MFGFGFVGPNAAALAMQRYPNAAGSAAAVLGSFQFGMAALIAPLAGAGGTHDATPMISLILGLSALAVAQPVPAGRLGPAADGPAGAGRGGGHRRTRTVTPRPVRDQPVHFPNGPCRLPGGQTIKAAP